MVDIHIVFRLGCVWRAHGLAGLRTAVSQIVLGVCFGVCLSAPQWAPTYELAGLCSRSAAKYQGLNGLSVVELLAIVAPKLFGHPIDGNMVSPALFGRSYLTMNTPFIGAFALGFIGLGTLHPRRGVALFFAMIGAGVIGFMLSLKIDLTHRILAALMPVDTLDHHRLLAVVALCGSALVGLGIDGLAGRHPAPARRRDVAAAVAGLLVVMAIAVAAIALRADVAFGSPGVVAYLRNLQRGRGLWVLAPQVLGSLVLLAAGSALACSWLWRPRSRALPLSAVVCIVGELLYFAWPYNPYVSRERVYPTTPAIEFLQAEAAGSRILGVEPPDAHPWKGDVLPPSAGMCYDISDVRGKEGMYPWSTRRFMETLRRRRGVQFVALVHFTHADSRIFDLLGARYVVSHRPLARAHLRSVFERELYIYENERCMPRTFTCPRAIVFESDDDLLAHMHQDSFDPRQAVLLASPPSLAFEPGGKPAEVSIVDDGPNRVALSVDAPSDCYLVLADTYFPGWRATIDGERAVVQSAYYLLRCVSVPKGKHEVVFDYWPVSFQAGLALCLAALAAAMLAGLLAAIRRHRQQPV